MSQPQSQVDPTGYDADDDDDVDPTGYDADDEADEGNFAFIGDLPMPRPAPRAKLPSIAEADESDEEAEDDGLSKHEHKRLPVAVGAQRWAESGWPERIAHLIVDNDELAHGNTAIKRLFQPGTLKKPGFAGKRKEFDTKVAEFIRDLADFTVPLATSYQQLGGLWRLFCNEAQLKALAEGKNRGSSFPGSLYTCLLEIINVKRLYVAGHYQLVPGGKMGVGTIVKGKKSEGLFPDYWVAGKDHEQYVGDHARAQGSTEVDGLAAAVAGQVKDKLTTYPHCPGVTVVVDISESLAVPKIKDMEKFLADVTAQIKALGASLTGRLDAVYVVLPDVRVVYERPA